MHIVVVIVKRKILFFEGQKNDIENNLVML